MSKPSKTTQPRIKGRFAPKPKEQPDRIKQIELDVNRHGVALITAVDRIDKMLFKTAQMIADQGREFKSKLNRIESSVTERFDALRMEQYAIAQPANTDAPIGLQPGDYCDASKEVADELTAMGFKWADGDRWSRPFIRITPDGAALNFDVWKSELSYTHLDAPTFLSRARVTAKDLGLKPVEAPAELNVGDWVEVIAPAGASDIIGCDRYRGTIAQVEPWSTYVTKEKAFYIRSIDCWFRASSLRKLSEAEIAAHLAAEESKCKEAERAEKVAKLRFGVRVRTAHGVGIYQMEDEHGAHVVVHPDTTGYHGIDQITILP
jgi:hypothetical protein